MQLHQLQPRHKPKTRKRIGRGGKKGASSGFGIGKHGASQPRIREILKRYPKLKGYRSSAVKKIAEVNLEILNKKFENGAVISPTTLLENRLIRRMKGRTPEVKILGTGDITKAFVFEKCAYSGSAKAKIEKAGGTIK